MVDDKLWLLDAMKSIGEARDDGVAQAGHYVTDARVQTLPPPTTLSRIGELLAWDFPRLRRQRTVTQRSAHLPTAASACSRACPSR